MSSKILNIIKKLAIPFLIIVPISLAIALLVAEKIIRFAQPQLTYNQAKNVSLRVSHKSDFLPSDLIPNHSTTHIGNTHEFAYPVRINSQGYRMEEFPIEKPQDEFRILMIGDSMTFGYGVAEEKDMPSLLKNNFNKYLAENGITDKKIQIINAGFTAGKAPDTYYLYLKKKGLALNPDLIIVNYFLNNDIADLADNIWEKQDTTGLPEKITSQTTEVERDYTRFKKQYQNWKFAPPVLRNSHLWILFATALESKSPETVTKIKKIFGLEEQLPLPSTLENENCLFLNDCSPKMQELFNRYFKVAKATIDLAKSNNIPIIIGLLPANPQVKEVAMVLGTRSRQGGPTEFEPQKRIEEFLKENQTEYIDSLPYVTDVKWEKYYFPKDGHPTEEGYQRLSQSYFDYLTGKWLLLDKINK